jgi:HlyD family secretion protein
MPSWRLLLAIVAVAIAGAGLYFGVPRAQNVPPVGMVRATEIRIQPEISGRLAAVRVKPGDPVHAGDVLAELANPELAAALAEARAATGEAVAVRNRVYAGPRREQVEILDREVQKAQSNLTLAEQHFARVAALAANQHASRQDLDEAAAEVAVAQAAVAMARSKHAEAEAGPTDEDRRTADAKAAAAAAAATVLERRLAKTILKAPVDGTVRIIAAEPGEAIAPGRTIVTLDAARGGWFSFVLREDRLAGAAIGATLQLTDSAGNTRAARITEIRALGEFATWRAARAVGDHDLNSFAVRADPVAAEDRLTPGMTVWLAGRP